MVANISSVTVSPTASPQMNVWPRCLCVGSTRRSRTVRNDNYLPLGESLPPSQGESRFPIDIYLSWMVHEMPQDLVTNAGEPCLIGSSKNQRGHFVDKAFKQTGLTLSRLREAQSVSSVSPQTPTNSSVQYPMAHSSQPGALASTRTVYLRFTTNVSTSTFDPRSNLMSTPARVLEQVSSSAPDRRSFLRGTASDPNDFVKGTSISISTAERIR